MHVLLHTARRCLHWGVLLQALELLPLFLIICVGQSPLIHEKVLTRGSWLLPAPVTDPLRLLAWLLGAAVSRLVMLL